MTEASGQVEESETLSRPQVSQNASFKSLPGLSVKDSLETIQKMHKFCEHPRKKLSRSYIKVTAAEKRQKRKLCQKRFERQNLSEVNLRKLRYHLSKEKIFNIYESENFAKKIKYRFREMKQKSAEHPKNEETEFPKELEGGSCDILEPMENLNLSLPGPSDCEDFGKNDEIIAGSQVYVCSPDVFEDPKEAGDFESVEKDYCFPYDDEERARILARRSVQWKNEVDVIYYAGDSNGGKIISREREPLREEADQQARHNKFIRLVRNKNVLSRMNSPQLREKLFKVFK